MGAAAAIIGALGGLAGVMGIITAMDVIPPITNQLDWTFWFQVAIVFLLSAIALALGKRGNFD